MTIILIQNHIKYITYSNNCPQTYPSDRTSNSCCVLVATSTYCYRGQICLSFFIEE